VPMNARRSTTKPSLGHFVREGKGVGRPPATLLQPSHVRELPTASARLLSPMVPPLARRAGPPDPDLPMPALCGLEVASRFRGFRVENLKHVGW
jgi:hypothetical protein